MHIPVNNLSRVIRFATLLAIAIFFAWTDAVRAADQEPDIKPPAAALAPLKNTNDTEVHGIKLGEFKIRSDYPAEAQKSTVRFVLFAAVKEDRLPAMESIVSQHRQKLRDEVITATRLTPLGMFEEADLKAFRRRIFVRLHRTVPELVIDDLYISDFGLIVKSL
jgi:hypothetical protein